jgi:NAD(P)H-quinone oxidoreductase subunit 5
MTASAAPLPAALAALLLVVPLAPLAAAALAARPSATVGAWALARGAATAALAAAVLAAAWIAATVEPGAVLAGAGLRADLPGAVMLVLVSFIGWVIVRYSQPYLAGERSEGHYVRWLVATLGCVGLVVVTNHLLVLALAWTATSLALHRLLTFYGDRPAAVIAAHKKFMAGRVADVLMLGAVGLLASSMGTLRLDELAARAAADALPLGAQVAVVAIALAAILKCAQLPFHGWLIQVMEAPTPVSALLHAGIVNLGGFVLLRVATLVGEVALAQALLVVTGLVTAVLAALVMSTRVSIKVALAWSTTAQMGFMLMQCGLGLWEMALLHLVAHSLYKAHAFLSAGGVVRSALLRTMAPRPAAPTGAALALAVVAGVVLMAVASRAWGVTPAGGLAAWVLAAIVALAVTPLVQARTAGLCGAWRLLPAAAAFGVAMAYVGLHLGLSAAVLPLTTPAPTFLAIGVAVGFAALFTLQSVVALRPDGPLARGAYPWFYGGFYLDERFTRLTFRLWPAPAARAAGTAAGRHGAAVAAAARAATGPKP